MMIATVFDTETTGLVENHTLRLEKQPEIIEFAAIRVEWEAPESELSRYQTLIRREGDWFAEEKNRPPISEEELATAPTLGVVADEIQRRLEESNVVVGHNLSFDMEIVDLAFDRLKRKIRWPKLRVCTVEQSIFYVGKRLSLGELHRRLLDREHRDAHRAMNDVEATLRCLIEMRRREWV